LIDGGKRVICNSNLGVSTRSVNVHSSLCIASASSRLDVTMTLIVCSRTELQSSSMDALTDTLRRGQQSKPGSVTSFTGSGMFDRSYASARSPGTSRPRLWSSSSIGRSSCKRELRPLKPLSCEGSQA
jgi:hypothetical protein